MPCEAVAQMEQDLTGDLRRADYTATGEHGFLVALKSASCSLHLRLPEDARSDMVSAAIAVACTGDHASPRASRIPSSRSHPPIRERQYR